MSALKKSFFLGANILLQRLMAQNNIYEAFNLFTFDTELNPSLVVYVRLLFNFESN